MMWCDWTAMGFVGWTTMIVFWAAIVGLVVWAVRSLRRSDARGILERRFASGEIGHDEFEERLRLLGGTRRSDR